MSCCPPGSLGAAPFNSLKAKGKMVELEASATRPSMPCYQTGPANPKRILLLFSDIFGIHSGLHKVACDVLQEKLGPETAVWMPDMFRGKPIVGSWGMSERWTMMFVIPSVVWACSTNMKLANVTSDLNEVVGPACKTTNVAVLGFCYGSWVAGRALAIDGFPAKAGIGIHPSFKLQGLIGEKEEDLAQKIGKKPYLFLPAGNDDLKVGNPIVEMMAKARGVEQEKVSIEFPDMIHGWVPRGDSSDPKVKDAQDKATTFAADFVKEHVKL